MRQEHAPSQNALRILVGAIAVAALIGVGFILGRSGNREVHVAPTSVSYSAESEGHVHSVISLPSGTILLGTHDGLLRKTGNAFSKIHLHGPVRSSDFMELAFNPVSRTLFAAGHGLGVIASVDDGRSWRTADQGIIGNDIHALTFNPLDPNRMFAYSVGNGVFETRDGGRTWLRIDDGPPNPGVRSFAYMPVPTAMDRSMGTSAGTNIGYLWAGTSGGLYSSFACFCGWTQDSALSNDATLTSLVVDPTNRELIYAVSRNGLFRSSDDGRTFAKIDSRADFVALAFAHDGELLAATQSGAVLATRNARSWIQIASLHYR